MSQMDLEADSAAWRKATYSIANGQCVEVGSAATRVFVRDSVNPSGAVIAYDPEAWQFFIDSTKGA
jgi:Domain of unknown function (DUF397)